MTAEPRMQQWTFRDRTGWPAGPWDGEADKYQWTDEATGLPCLIVRNSSLCGYVGVAEGHPLYGLPYDDAAAERAGLTVHGGLTYAAPCEDQDRKEHGICHVPEPGQPDNVWWFGFDCAHGGDVIPGYGALGLGPSVYRDVAYVRAECRRLAAQLAHADRGGRVDTESQLLAG